MANKKIKLTIIRGNPQPGREPSCGFSFFRLCRSFLFYLQQMRQCRVILYALQLIGDNLFHFRLDAVVVLLYHLFHAVVPVLVPEIGIDRNKF